MTWTIIGIVALVILFGLLITMGESNPAIVYCSKCKHCRGKDSWCMHPKHIIMHGNFYEEYTTNAQVDMKEKNSDNKCKDFEWSAEELNNMIPDRGN